MGGHQIYGVYVKLSVVVCKFSLSFKNMNGSVGLVGTNKIEGSVPVFHDHRSLEHPHVSVKISCILGSRQAGRIPSLLRPEGGENRKHSYHGS